MLWPRRDMQILLDQSLRVLAFFMQSEIYSKPGWRARGDFLAPESDQRRPFLPRMKHALRTLGLVARFVYYALISWWNGRGYFMDIFRSLWHNPFAGVPCGGIGSGGIGRDFRGGFCRFSLLPGIVEQRITYVKADQFVVTIRRSTDGVCVYQKVLSCALPDSSSILSCWDFSFPPHNLHYRGLYPRSWTLYEITDYDICLMCRQISPVIPNNYKDSSLPLCLFVWTVKNNSPESYRVSLTFTFRNGTGNSAHEKSNCSAEMFESDLCTGIKLYHSIDGLNVCYALAVMHSENATLTFATFDPISDGSEIWNTLYEKGNFGENGFRVDKSDELGVAACAEIVCQPKSSAEVEFLLAWDMPVIKFGSGKREYKRRYSRFFHGTGKNSITEMCTYGFSSRVAWEDKIEYWQREILEDNNLPDWYKSALFNELYYMTDGGTIWVEYDKSWRNDEKQMSDETVKQFEEFGRFAYLESFEYHMLNTYDVHFYSSFAFLMNWPEIELSIQLDYADQLLFVDERRTGNIYEGTVTQAKQYGRIPHDMGNPMDEPWLFMNAYMLNDTSEWKDLNLKFVLASYRDYELIVAKKGTSEESNLAILRRFYELISEVVNNSQKWDVDGDGMIENAGTPDQTYDVWCMAGTSAYCGGLWLCALECYRRLAKKLGMEDDARRLVEQIALARKAYESKLWNGSYFNFDEHSENRTTIMADQLCAFWYLCTIDGTIDQKLLDARKVASALEMIYEMNVKKFAAGCLGPVNGMRPSGEVDLSSIQSEEVWGGTAYALASFQILMDKRNEGFATAEGWYRSCWEKFGLQYQSPEAITEHRYYRAIGYMRPMAVWAIQWALNLKKLSH